MGWVAQKVAAVLTQKVEKKFKICRQILSSGSYRPHNITGLKGFAVKRKAG
jgi:hypothetical protein